MKPSSSGAPLQKCGKCKTSWYCSKNCQKQNWPKHKQTCHEVEGSGISRLVRKLAANKLLLVYLQVCLVLHFDLLHNPTLDKPFMARIDVGIEPSDISVFLQLFAGIDRESRSQTEGMLQLNALTPCELATTPLTQNRLKLWRHAREEANAEGCSLDPVGLVEFVNDSEHSLTIPIHIQSAALLIAQRADPFTRVSALTGRRTETPLSDMSCLEFINTHIRADSKNLLLLRTNMREADKEIIHGAGRGEDKQAVVILKEKMARELIYRVHYTES
jgi:hypothetical protein